MAIVFDNQPQVQRWRDETTGRFAKKPVENIYDVLLQYRPEGVHPDYFDFEFRVTARSEEEALAKALAQAEEETPIGFLLSARVEIVRSS